MTARGERGGRRGQGHGPPIRRYSGRVELVRDDAALARMGAALADERLLGFDIETRPAFKRGQSYKPSVVQFAADCGVYVVQLARIRNRRPLAALFEAERPVKAGVGIADDIRKLREAMDFEPAGFVDFGNAARAAGFASTGLRNLARACFGFRISKRAQLTNWAAQELTEAQVLYAATDAWVSRELYLWFEAHGWLPEAEERGEGGEG